MRLYRYFLDGIPYYLARYYWWAYLWRPAIWFFDHQPVINAILFGQYKKLMAEIMRRVEGRVDGLVLQLTCVYGCLTPNLIKKFSLNALHIADVSDAQLEKAHSKISNASSLLATRMNVEQMAYKDSSFSMVIIFFLLHEMPSEARRNTLAECMRVLSAGGSFILAEYGSLPSKHFLYRFYPGRWLLTKLEPFLDGYWHADILAELVESGKAYGKSAEVISHSPIFSSFYRVTEFRVVNEA